MEKFDVENYVINLGFIDFVWGSCLFWSMSDEFFMEVVLFLGWLVFNNYELGIYLDVFVNNMEFSKYMKVLFVDFDCNGKLFVFIVEGKDLLLYVI